MPTSEARILANRQNAALSTGPKTAEGKAQSRENAFKHGMTGEGVVLPNEAAAEVERRFRAFRAELQPSGEMGETLVRRAAVLSVRLDRCVSQETGAIAERIRQAEADFVPPAGLDASTVEQLKAEAKARAMFDPSKEANLARKYEAAAERGFFRALKEFRQLEKQAQAAHTAPTADHFDDTLASFFQAAKASESRQARDPEPQERTPSKPSKPLGMTDFATSNGRVDVPITIGRRS